MADRYVVGKEARHDLDAILAYFAEASGSVDQGSRSTQNFTKPSTLSLAIPWRDTREAMLGFPTSSVFGQSTPTS